MGELVRAASWGSILSGIRNTGPNVVDHPNSTLDAQAASYAKARKIVLELDLDIQALKSKFKTVLEDVEKHYNEQVDELETEFREKSSVLDARYREAYYAFERVKSAFSDMMKQVDARVEFVNHFPVPKDDDNGQPSP